MTQLPDHPWTDVEQTEAGPDMRKTIRPNEAFEYMRGLLKGVLLLAAGRAIVFRA